MINRDLPPAFKRFRSTEHGDFLMSEHTPIPWIVDDRHIHCTTGLVYKDDRMLFDGEDVVVEVNTDCREGGLLTETDKANLQFIVRAVNSYDELVEALKTLRRELWAANLRLNVQKHFSLLAADAQAGSAIHKATL